MAIDPAAIWAQAQLDPSYIAAHGANTQALKAAILGYGDTSALSPALAAQYGIAPGDISAANSNPYSVTAQLRNQLAGDNTNIQRTANAHGALFSGANAAQTANEQQASGQRSYNALQTLQGQIAGIGSNDTTALTGAYGNLTAQALADQTVPAPVSTDITPPGSPVSGPPAYTNTPGSLAPDDVFSRAANIGATTGINPSTGVKLPKPPKVPANVTRNAI